jgi:hypothetical protein
MYLVAPIARIAPTFLKQQAQREILRFTATLRADCLKVATGFRDVANWNLNFSRAIARINHVNAHFAEHFRWCVWVVI